ncbi:hypothetical protein BFW01_g6413 [Lasiodiplodia theobromae]|uniref:Uncharacterized protein n=1 Tax=Lasiodiplodia theobromae TaxID=45133 RepID=A0A5N5CZT2_9PEZI|nr:hypothetical protein DBV05_g10404 [Lasiodiplodia theobromae]KAF9635518.1 hypothetical protein BFW01_g6413 [Lasiodiplodia theobromae]
MRTRSGKGKLSESATPAPQHHDSSLDTSSSGSSKTSRKLTRSSSTNSMHSQIFVASHDDIVAFYSKPVLTISGLSEDFLGRLEREDELRHRSSRPKSLYEQFQEIERESSSQNEDPSQNGNDHERPKRGNRGRPAKIQKQHPSPRKRRARPRKSLADVDEEDYMSRPQTPSVADADEDANPDNAEPSGEPSEAADQDQADDSPSPDDPDASPSHQLISETTGTYRSTATSAPIQPSPPREPRPKPIYQDEELEDDDLPPPFTNTPGTPSESEVDDDANRILRKRFDYMTDPQKFIAALTKHLPSERTSEVLYALAENTQAALKAWQDEYLAIDKRVAAHANNGPRKPVNGGRVPVDPKVFDDQKEADIYSYVYDARKPPGTQDPFSQRIGTDYVGGRELRHRRARDVTTEDLAQSEEDVGKRKRRAAQRFDGAADSGSRTRKRDHAGSETPEPPGPRKRGKVGSATKRQSVVPPRIREMRGESAMTTSASEDDDTYEGTPEPRGPGKRRGRPPGSKNLAQRKDAGIKKGPRGKKGAAAAQAAVNAANNEQNSTQTTFPSAPSAVTTAPPQQQPQQQQPFFVQGYSHAPHSNIPPVSAAPVPGINADPTFISTHPQQTAQHPYGAGVPIQAPLAPGTPAQANGHAQHISAPTSTPASTTHTAQTPTSAGSSTTASGRKKGVKSEKRSASMTQWWAERKARQAADRLADQQRQAAAEAQSAAAAAQNPQGYGLPVNGYKGPYPPTQPAFQGYTSTQPAAQQSSFRAIAPGPHQGQGAQAQAQTHHHHHHIPQTTHHHHTPPATHHPSTQAAQPAKQAMHHGPFGYDGAGSPPPPIHGNLHHGQPQEGVPDSLRRDILGLRGRPEPRRGL